MCLDDTKGHRQEHIVVPDAQCSGYSAQYYIWASYPKQWEFGPDDMFSFMALSLVELVL